MKILQLSKKFPYPLKDGESLAITYMAQALHELGAEVDLLSMNTSKHYFDIKELPEDFRHYGKIKLVDIDNRLDPKAALLNLFSNKSYHIERFESAHYAAALKELLQAKDYDVVQLETLYLAPYIPVIRQYSKAKVVMRSHNVEHEIWERIRDNCSFGPKKWYLQLLSKRLADYELKQLNNYDLFLAITARDLQRFRDLGLKTAAQVVPIGLDLSKYPKRPLPAAPKKIRFSFIGSLDWMPNIEGLRWLLDEVWPQFVAQHPEAEFHVAGRNSPDWLNNLRLKGLKVHGEVPSAQSFIQEYEIMLVPLKSGSGMRVKILEAMGMGRLVLSTSIGLEGIHAQDGQEVLIADDAAAFLQQMKSIYQQPYKLSELAAKGRQFIHQNYDKLRIAQGVLEAYERLQPQPVD
ncbi:glycosyltransferase family 4 protein [Saprospira grandis]|uniref:glycosyltransferase family 4 protein n=1 Tax=Saprospira grandis TaxID=1008 RepID=UPI0022DDE62B|nr:glycosyltransferase family 4 protein [Saprospira grandis]WBM74201.1 glycosyltransferase family 4 protein [Saprospira grandis]